MTLDDYFRDQISRGQPPMVALHNAAQEYAAIIKLEYRRPDCSQYADENAAWGKEHDVQTIKHLSDQFDEMIFRIDHGGMDALVQLSDRFRKLVDRWRKPQGDKQQDSEAVELLREVKEYVETHLLLAKKNHANERAFALEDVRKFLEGKQ